MLLACARGWGSWCAWEEERWERGKKEREGEGGRGGEREGEEGSGRERKRSSIREARTIISFNAANLKIKIPLLLYIHAEELPTHCPSPVSSTHSKSCLSSDMIFKVSALGLAEYLLAALFSAPCWCPPSSCSPSATG